MPVKKLPKKVFVTGACGYIGSVLCPLLDQNGFSVTALDLSGPDRSISAAAENIQWVLGDARDERTLRPLVRQTDIIIPLAALVGANPCERDPETARSINFEAIRLLNRLRSPDQRVIYPMTNSIYHPSMDQDVISEDYPAEAHSIYAKTKLDAEAELLEKGNALSLRLASVYGLSPSMRWGLLLNHFVHLAHSTGEIRLYEKEFKRNFLHIRDAAECFLHFLRLPSESGVFNAGSENLTKKELVEKIKSFFPHLKVVPLAGASDPDQRNFFISCEKLYKTGYKPMRTIDLGIQELMAACPESVNI